MEKLTDRQVELITNMLTRYDFFYKNSDYRFINNYYEFYFNEKTYKIARIDYDDVCEIIDYIKGVKHD